MFNTLLFIELFKLGNTYLPGRYLLSSVVANALYFCICIEISVDLFADKMKIVILGIILFVTGISFYQNALSFNRRTFVLQEINDYLSKTKFQGKTLMGNWAAACGWKTDAYFKPLARGYNEHDTFGKLRPRAIITENDESDTEKILARQGINISDYSDSTRTFRINQWDVVVYWIKQ
ncbi:MAG: hypothetical protein ACHQK8_08590 [Bacteroidia bacterium]